MLNNEILNNIYIIPLSASTDDGPFYLHPKIKSIQLCNSFDTYSLSNAYLLIVK